MRLRGRDMSKTAEEYELEIERLNGQIEALQSGYKKTRLRRKVREHASDAGIALGNNELDGSRLFRLEKFASSIVRECSDIALREDFDPSDCILKEFGIER